MFWLGVLIGAVAVLAYGAVRLGIDEPFDA
jgi:hypothetical protein